MSVTYLRPLLLPAKVRVEAEVIQFGRSMSLVRGNITSKDGQTAYFTGEQHKANSASRYRTLSSCEAGKTKL